MLSTWIQSKKDEEGFTLIELLVVVIIIGILAAIAIPVFLNQRDSAQRNALQSSIQSAVTQIEVEYTGSATNYEGAAEAAGFDATTDLQPVGDDVLLRFNYYTEGTGADQEVAYCVEGRDERLEGGDTWAATNSYNQVMGGEGLGAIDDDLCVNPLTP